jgi:hypothetical protein
MENITSSQQLKQAIVEREIKCARERMELKRQFDLVRESFRPVNLLKDSFKSVISSPGLKENVLTTIISLGAGYLAKKVVVGSTINPLKKLAGILLQMGVAKTVADHKDGLKSIGKNLWEHIVQKKKQNEILENTD